MRSLAVDTATNTLSLAVFDDEKLVASYELTSKKQHGETLVNEVNHLLKALGWNASDIEEIFIGIGPGSYTGLRIGVTFAKMWGSMKEIPVREVSSLSLLAASAIQLASQNEDVLLVPMIDSRRMTAYTGIYKYEAGKLVEVLEDDQVEWDTFKNNLSNYGDKFIIIGQELDAFVDSFPEDLDLVQVISEAPKASQVYNVGSELVEDVDVLVPNYLQKTLAERQWQEANPQEVAGDTSDETYIDYTG